LADPLACEHQLLIRSQRALLFHAFGAPMKQRSPSSAAADRANESDVRLVAKLLRGYRRMHGTPKNGFDESAALTRIFLTTLTTSIFVCACVSEAGAKPRDMTTKISSRGLSASYPGAPSMNRLARRLLCRRSQQIIGNLGVCFL
jgi:hypothetical protein